MRKLLLLALLLAAPAIAQKAPPKDLQPLPEPPPPPPGMTEDPLEPQVTIVKRAGETVEEYRVSGKLYMMKVTPAHGRSYYLIDHRGDGTFSRQDSFDSGLRVPQWVLHQF
ncbi:MAG: DUF2782 domain-containing protein [Betaproteobacteria bacterium]|jgi:hypothetical protein|nr:DUF2782 domain-containing protein [Betaproteobacteria bacterium]